MSDDKSARSGFVEEIRAAQAAYAALGPLSAYDDARNGPLLGVSDSGYSSDLIARTALQSAKINAGGNHAANGVMLDAERMGSAGEVPVGPDEYAMVAAAARGATYFSTNVGVRANARYLQPSPALAIGDLTPEDAVEKVTAQFAPFLKPPGGQPRPLTVHLHVQPRTNPDALTALAARIETLRGSKLAGPNLHKLAALVVFDAPPGAADIAWLAQLIDRAAAAKIPIVAIDAPPGAAAHVHISVQGVLNALDPPAAMKLLAAAARNNVALVPRYQVDTETVRRTIWAALHTARAHGLNGAKYGLTPLTMEEQRPVITAIQAWAGDWTTIPAFYADTPLVTAADVLLSDRVVAASLQWLDMAHAAGARVVLFDCPDRYVPRIDSSGQAAGRHLLRHGPEDRGAAYSLADVDTILAHARTLGVKILWSGGIQADQAFELAKRRVSGIFTTSSTAKLGPVTPVLADDPRLAAESVPTETGVRRVHALIQAGFLIAALAQQHAALAKRIGDLCPPVLAAPLESAELKAALDKLDDALIEGWKLHWHA